MKTVGLCFKEEPKKPELGIDEIRKTLDEKGVEYDKKAKKKELADLLNKVIQEESIITGGQ